MRPKVSVIIPVYNSEAFIEQCLSSVMEQTLREIEIIVVDDMSTDHSMEIVENLRKQDNRIKTVYHETEKWLGPTRNTGIAHSKGESIYFLDADDWIEKNALEVAYHYLEKTGSQFVDFRSRRVFDNGDMIDLTVRMENHLIQDKNIYLQGVLQSRYSVTAWNKLFDCDFIKENKLLFDNVLCFEDFLFTLKTYVTLEKIYIIPDVLHNYRQNPNSLMNRKLTNKCMKSIFDVLMHCIQFIVDNNLLNQFEGEQLIHFAFHQIIKFGDRYNNEIDNDITLDDIIMDFATYVNNHDQNNILIYLLTKQLYERHRIEEDYLKTEKLPTENFERFVHAKYILERTIKNQGINATDRMIVYGTGDWGERFYHILKRKNFHIIAFSDSDQKKWGTKFCGLDIICPEQLKRIEFDKILIASSKYNEISKSLNGLGFEAGQEYIRFAL